MAPELTQFKFGGGRWVGDKAFRGFVEKFAKDPDAYFRLDKFMVSDRKMRSVAVTEVDERTLAHVKKYKENGFIQRLRARMGRAQADLEFKHLVAARKAGLPAPEVIFFGRLGEDAYVATRLIGGARPLIEILREKPRALDAALIKGVAALVARAHEAGFLHRDLHLGNILEDEYESLHLVDMHRMEVKGRVTDEEAAENLGQLDFSFSRVTGREKREALVKAYCGIRKPGMGMEGFRALVSEASMAWGERHFRSRTRRCVRDGENYVVEKVGGFGVWRKATFKADIGDIVRRHRGGGERVLKENAKTRATVVEDSSGGQVCVKEFRARGLGAAFETMFRGSRGGRTWVNANGLAIRGTGTPEPLAYIKEGRKEYFVTRFEEGAEPLDEYLRARFERIAGKSALHEKWEFMRRIGGMLAELHGAEVYHKDLKANNVLAAWGESGPRFLLLDLDRVRFDRALSRDEKEFNLACLNAAVANFITVTDRLRAFKAYVGTADIQNHKAMLRGIRDISLARNHFWRI